MAETKCTVCEAIAVGSFCENCGQKIGRTETTLLSMFRDIVSNVFSMEKSVFAGIKSVLFSPGKLIENYFEGNRNYYPSPGKLLFYALTFAAFHVAFTDSKILGIRLDLNDKNPQFLFWLFFIPIMTLTSYLAFVKSDRRITKHFIAVLYLSSSFFIVFTILNDLIIWLYRDLFSDYLFAAYSVLFFTWNSIVFTKGNKPLKVGLNVLLQLVIFVAFILLSIGVVYLINIGL